MFNDLIVANRFFTIFEFFNTICFYFIFNCLEIKGTQIFDFNKIYFGSVFQCVSRNYR